MPSHRIHRDEGDDEPRTVNHHGNAVKVKPALKTTYDPESPVNGASTVTPQVKMILQSNNLTMEDLMARNEEVLPYKYQLPLFLTQNEITARKTLYNGANENGTTLLLLKMFANKGIPVIFVIVQLSFWTIGLFHIYTQ